MRMLPLLVAGLALTTSTVSAKCTGLGVAGGTPSPNALVLFVTAAVTKGSFPTAGSTGLQGGDNICNNDADPDNFATLNVAKGRGLYKALLSNQIVNAKDRFISGPTSPGGTTFVDPSWDVMDANGVCIAASVADLFDCSHFNTLNDYNTAFADSQGSYYTNSPTAVWTGSDCSGQRWHISGGGGGSPVTDPTLIQQSYCSQVVGGIPNPLDGGWSYENSPATGHIGKIFLASVAGSDWIDLTSGSNAACSSGLHLYCLQAAPAPTTAPPTTIAPTSGGHGDPQFTGLQGQSFQVHGMPDEFFNLITTPDMQLNSRFTYLASGTCNYNNTDCWTHPGTYVDQLGFMFPSLRIKAVAGSHDNGMVVHINDVRMEVTEQPMEYTIRAHAGAGSYAHNETQGQTVRVSYPKHDVLMVHTDMFTVTATNSDMFFNFGVEMHDRSLLSLGAPIHHIRDSSEASHKYPAYPIHGFLGQTWKNARYKHGQLYAGSVDDYMMLDSKLFSTKFQFNQYQH